MAKLKVIEGGTEPAPLDLFSYAALAEPVAIQAREAAERIKLRLRRSAEDIIEIGRDLIAVKESLPHGQFLPWIDAEFGMSDETARKMMRVADVYGAKYQPDWDLSLTALYELAAPKTPIEVREEVEKMIEAGEVVTKATVQELRSRLDRAEKARALATQEVEEKSAKVAEIEGSISSTVSVEIEAASKRIAKGFEAEIARLKREVADLKKPKLAVTADIGDGTVVEFHRPLTDQEKADIDATDDEYASADFNKVASDEDRARAVAGSIQLIASAAAKPAAVYSELTARFSKKLIAENFVTLDRVLALLQKVKGMQK